MIAATTTAIGATLLTMPVTAAPLRWYAGRHGSDVSGS